MWQYSWPAWMDRVGSSDGEWALERWLLMYLHDQQNTNALALAIMEHLNAVGQHVHVRVQSTWVDGTPQAEFSPEGHSPHKTKPQCELADLLLCVRRELPNGQLQREQAMLVQAKVANRFDTLPGGKSTKKERLLYEKCDRNQDITLYSGVNKGTPIGVYQLGDWFDEELYGLHDCARFLLMAKAPWAKVSNFIGPLQVGWPINRKNHVGPTESYLDAVINMVAGVQPRFWREVKTGASALNCAWTKMVNDLRGKYKSVTMNGYNGQPRVTTSSTKVFSPHLLYSILSERGRDPTDTSNRLRQNWFSLNLQHLLEPQIWNGVKYFKLLLDRMPINSWENAMEMSALFGGVNWQEIELWPDTPNSPPPNDIDFNDGNAPHISTLIITIRSAEQDDRPD